MSIEPFWSIPVSELLHELESSPQGLTAAAAAERRMRYGPNTVGERARSNVPMLLLRQTAACSLIVLLYLASAEAAKRRFYRWLTG